MVIPSFLMAHLISVTDEVILRLCKDVTGHLEILPISLGWPQRAVRPVALAMANHGRPTDATSCPNDLQSALTRLSDEELQALAKALNNEQDRRNGQVQLERPTQAPEEPRRPAPLNRKTARIQTSKSGPPPLTQTRIRAIREAIKAGVKPRTVARQFGISLPALQKALSDKSD